MLWEELKYWQSDDWKKVQEKLDALDRSGVGYNPGRKHTFNSLSLTPFETVKVAIIGQDPYPLILERHQQLGIFLRENYVRISTFLLRRQVH